MKQSEWWISWYTTDELGAFELHWPWWISGYSYVEMDGEEIERPTIVAAIRAQDEGTAMWIVTQSYDNPPSIDDVEWRFCDPMDGPPYPWDHENPRFPMPEWARSTWEGTDVA